jgi:DNA-binding NarL/FixJ family response regulator
MGKIRVLAVDDHAVVLEGLCTLLRLEDPDIEVVGTALNGQEALEREQELVPDVVLLDIKMPIIDGVEVARRLKRRRPDVKILMLTTFDDRDLIAGALEAGANGYLLKDASAADVIDAIKHVNNGNVLLSGDLAVKLSSRPVVDQSPRNVGIDVDPAALEGLSEREVQVLRLMAEGKSNPEISKDLNLGEKTVRNYVSHIYDALNVHSRTRAALWAADNLRSSD